MFDATSQSETRSGVLADGRAEISFAKDGAETRLVHLYHRDPLRFLFPTSSAGDCLQAALVTTSGGLVGGDRLTIDVKTHDGAAALVSPTAAEKVYRSSGPDGEIDVALHAEDHSWLEWLPQETILFNDSRMKRVTRIDADGDARVLAGEMLVFGRIGRGERLTHGLVRECWEVRRNGHLTWMDSLLLEDDIGSIVAHPAGFDGATATASVVYAGPDAEARLADARDALADTPDVRAGATAVNGVLIARFHGRDALALRTGFGKFWSTFRHRVAKLPAALPRLWHV